MRDFITVWEKFSNSPAYLIKEMYSDPIIAGYLNKTWFLSGKVESSFEKEL